MGESAIVLDVRVSFSSLTRIEEVSRVAESVQLAYSKSNLWHTFGTGQRTMDHLMTVASTNTGQLSLHGGQRQWRTQRHPNYFDAAAKHQRSAREPCLLDKALRPGTSAPSLIGIAWDWRTPTKKTSCFTKPLSELKTPRENLMSTPPSREN